MKLLIIALAALASLSAETVDFSFIGHQDSVDANYLGSGSFVVPNGTVTANISTLDGFNLTLYDIIGTTNPAFAYATYHMNTPDLLDFSATFDGSGDLEQLTFDTAQMDPNPANTLSSVGADWTPDGIQPMGRVGGFQDVSFIVNSATNSVPEPSYSFAAGLLLFGVAAWRRLSSRLS